MTIAGSVKSERPDLRWNCSLFFRRIRGRSSARVPTSFQALKRGFFLCGGSDSMLMPSNRDGPTVVQGHGRTKHQTKVAQRREQMHVFAGKWRQYVAYLILLIK